MTHKHLSIIISILTLFTISSFAGDIDPTSGEWKPKMLSHDIKGCPSMMQAAFKKAQLYSKTKKANFTKPFNPNDLFDPKDLHPKGKTLKWTKTAPNEWTTTLNIKDAAAAGMAMNVTWDLKVTSETSMDIKSRLSMQFPKELIAMMGGSSVCKVYSGGVLERIGN